MANVWLGVVLVAVLAAVLLRAPPGLNLHEIDSSFAEKQTMQAAVFSRHGAAVDVIEVKSVPLPLVRSNDVVIRVHAAALNPVDWKIIKGYLAFLEGWMISAPPTISGMDAAGEVVAVGSGVTNFAVGDRVFCMADFRRNGTLAQYVAQDASLFAKIPDGISYEDAASIPLVGHTGWQGLVNRAHVKPGDRVLVLAGSGGTGGIGVQLAKQFGAYVIATCSAASADLVKSLGADEIIDYRTQNFTEVLKNDPVDVVYDTVGGPTNWQDSLPIMKPGATFLAIAGDGGFVQMSPSFLLKAGLTMLKRSKPFEDAWFRAYHAQPNGAELAEMAAMMKAGTLRAVIDSTYELSDVKGAFARMVSGRAKGKIVVRIP